MSTAVQFAWCQQKVIFSIPFYLDFSILLLFNRTKEYDITQFSNYCFQTKISRQLVHSLYPHFSHSYSPLSCLVKIFNSSTRHYKKLSSTHLFSVISADSIFSELWNFSHRLILYPGAESMKLGQEAKSVNSLGCCPKFCLSEGLGRQLSSFSLPDYVPGSLGLPARMKQ